MAMRSAMAKARATDPGAATAIIQSALQQAGLEPGSAPERGLGTDFLARFRAQGCAPCAGGGPGLGRLDGLSSLPGLKMPGRDVTPPVPEGARYEARSLGGRLGRRDCKLLVPSERPGGPTGLVMMLHGCTQTPDDFALGTRMNLAAERAGFVTVYPAQTRAENIQSCWNWFRPEDQAKGAGEPGLLAEIAAGVGREFGIPPERTFCAGLSAGGAMAAILLETHPEVFAAAGIHSGLPAGSAQDVVSAFAAMRGDGGSGIPSSRPVIVFHGTADATVAPVNGARLVPGSGIETSHRGNGRTWSRLVTGDGSELWRIEGAGHAWSGGDAAGSYADPLGPDASAEMLRFFEDLAPTG